jgi:hypothetical protein
VILNDHEAESTARPAVPAGLISVNQESEALLVGTVWQKSNDQDSRGDSIVGNTPMPLLENFVPAARNLFNKNRIVSLCSLIAGLVVACMLVSSWRSHDRSFNADVILKEPITSLVDECAYEVKLLTTNASSVSNAPAGGNDVTLSTVYAWGAGGSGVDITELISVPPTDHTQHTVHEIGNHLLSNDSLREAVRMWQESKVAATAKYGDISTWNTSLVTSMRQLFKDCMDFNDHVGT